MEKVGFKKEIVARNRKKGRPPGEARETYAAFLRLAPPEAKEQIDQAKRNIGR